MLNVATLAAQAFGSHLGETYRHYFGGRGGDFATLIDAGARLVVERIACSDALYHNYEHTILVTLVGQEIIRGKLLVEPLEPEDWLHFIYALLCHDIGFVRGACAGDDADGVVIDEAGGRMGWAPAAAGGGAPPATRGWPPITSPAARSRSGSLSPPTARSTASASPGQSSPP